MPPSAAPECDRVGWSFEITATSAPASCASMAARMPAQPAPTTSTSCVASTCGDATESPGALALDNPQRAVRAFETLRALDLGETRLEEEPTVEHRPAHGCDRRHERPGADQAVDVRSALPEVDLDDAREVFAALVLAARLGLATIAACQARERLGQQLDRQPLELRDERLHRLLGIERRRPLREHVARVELGVHQ